MRTDGDLSERTELVHRLHVQGSEDQGEYREERSDRAQEGGSSKGLNVKGFCPLPHRHRRGQNRKISKKSRVMQVYEDIRKV